MDMNQKKDHLAKLRLVGAKEKPELPYGIKIIFFGTPEFAKIVLGKIIKTPSFKDKKAGHWKFEILAAVTAPDKPVGRKRIPTPPPVKVLAQENNIPVLQPTDLTDQKFARQLKSFSPDLIVVAAYGKIIPKNILDIPKFGSLNIHPSLLPKYRGASPIQSAILNGDKETGVTIMLMDEKMDHGDIISKFQFPISNDDTYEFLSKKMAELGAGLLIKTIPDYVAGKIKPIGQEHDKATYCKIIKKNDGKIDWSKSAQEIYNQWRAFYPWPGVFFQSTINNQQITIKLIEINLSDVKNEGKNPGEFFVKNKHLYIACGQETVLEIKKLQPAGKKVMTAKEFVNGYLK